MRLHMVILLVPSCGHWVEVVMVLGLQVSYS